MMFWARVPPLMRTVPGIEGFPHLGLKAIVSQLKPPIRWRKYNTMHHLIRETP